MFLSSFTGGGDWSTFVCLCFFEDCLTFFFAIYGMPHGQKCKESSHLLKIVTPIFGFPFLYLDTPWFDQALSPLCFSFPTLAHDGGEAMLA